MIVSNSRVKDLSCERKHFYAHELRLAPKQYPDPLFRGIVGHEALAEYYKFIKAEGWEKHEEAKKLALDFLFKECANHLTQIHVVNRVRELLTKYFERYSGDRFKILEVEKYYEEVRDGYPSYGLRLDTLIEMDTGPYKGQLIVMDHKFTYNFFSAQLVELDVQLPKYIGVLRRAGYPVSRGMFNQIRTREWGSNNESDLFKRAFTEKYSDREIEQIEREHNQAARRIEGWTELPLGIRELDATRNPSAQNCNYCSFTDLCALDRQGKDTSRTRTAHYKVNPYGYGK